MLEEKGATTVGEGKLDFKTDVGVVFNGGREQRKYILRTTLESISQWKSKHTDVPMSPYKDRSEGQVKSAAIVDGEVWVFGVNASNASDLVVAVRIAMKYFKISASTIFKDIFTKNLNAEHENNYGSQALVDANKKLYSSICKALVDAGRLLGVSGELRLGVFSKNNNPKIPQNELYQSLKDGGAHSVDTDQNTYKVKVANNEGTRSITQKTNYHLAVFNLRFATIFLTIIASTL